MTACPYKDLAPPAFWEEGVARRAASDVDPIVTVPFKLDRAARIATAGSCFAQHISRRLSASGYNYFVVEPGYPRMPEALSAKFNYGTFSARYGNIYTVRQLLQLFDRAYGKVASVNDFWRSGSRWVDPFRPFIQPHGFETLREAELDREQHLWAVRGLFENLDVFVFTLGLTEAWIRKADGAVLPVCPGCGAGSFDTDQYEFKNFEVEEVVADLLEFVDKLRIVNSGARIILTVSPVPLVATYSGRHVLAATAYSKAVLRVAADRVARTTGDCAYFPAFEIINGAFNRGRYFEEDLRSVSEEGIQHVMGVFFRHFCADPGPTPGNETEGPVQTAVKIFADRPRTAIDQICDEYVSLNTNVADN